MRKPAMIIALLLILSVVVLTVIDTGDRPDAEPPASKQSSIVHDSGWAVVPKQENGERVYWFIAPDENGVSPGVFRKTIHNGDDGKQFTIVSECEAPKATCDRLMQQFEELSRKYD